MDKIPVDMDVGLPKLQPGADPKPLVTWSTRRKMAWVALISNVTVIPLVMFAVPAERLPLIADLMTNLLFVNMGIIFAYMGFTSLPFIGKPFVK